MVFTILLVVAVASFVVSVIGSMAALVTYMRRDDASMFGFGFANFFWGEMRKTHRNVFFASIGGALFGVLFIVVAGVLR